MNDNDTHFPTETEALSPRGEHEGPVYAILARPGGDELPVPVTIDPARSILDQARDLIGAEIELVICRRFPQATIHAAVDEWGATKPDRVLNPHAWACYGGSPIYGTAVLFADSDGWGRPVPIPPDIVAEVCSPIPSRIRVQMYAYLREFGGATQ